MSSCREYVYFRKCISISILSTRDLFYIRVIFIFNVKLIIFFLGKEFLLFKLRFGILITYLAYILLQLSLHIARILTVYFRYLLFPLLLPARDGRPKLKRSRIMKLRSRHISVFPL